MFHDRYHLKKLLAAGVTLGNVGIRHTQFAISKPQSLPAVTSSFSFSQTPHINSDMASVYNNLTAYLFYMFLQHCSHLKDIIKDTVITDLSVFHNCVLKQKPLHAYLNFKFTAGFMFIYSCSTNV